MPSSHPITTIRASRSSNFRTNSNPPILLALVWARAMVPCVREVAGRDSHHDLGIRLGQRARLKAPGRCSAWARFLRSALLWQGGAGLSYLQASPHGRWFDAAYGSVKRATRRTILKIRVMVRTHVGVNPLRPCSSEPWRWRHKRTIYRQSRHGSYRILCRTLIPTHAINAQTFTVCLWLASRRRHRKTGDGDYSLHIRRRRARHALQ